MTNNYKFARFATLLLVFFAFLTQTAKAQLEPFAQASGFVSATNGWAFHGGTSVPVNTPPYTQQISIVAGSLAYTGLAAPTGNKISIVAGNTEDINKGLTAAITTTGYYSAIINVVNTTGLTTTGDYFMHFGGATGTSMSGFMGRLYVKTGATANSFNIGLLNNSGAGNTPTYVATDYPAGTPIFIVVKYDRTLTAGGTASLFVNPTLGGTEPTANLTNATGAGVPSMSLLSICIRQVGTAIAGSGNIEIDEIRGGTTWADVTPASVASAPTIAITQGATAIPTANSPAFNMGSVATSTDLDVTFTVTNAGTAPLTLTLPITIAGTGFSILTPPTSPVANGATTTFVVRFNSATAVANAVGTVTITNNANTTYVVNLTATANAAATPSIAITQGATAIPTANSPAFNMGSVVTSTDLDVTFTVTNAGTAPLTLTLPITIAGTGFSIFTQPTSPVANGASNTTTFVVRFNSATAVANAVGTVTIINNANTTYVVNLTASATAPVVGGADYEPFNQASGSVATTNGWVTHGGAIPPLSIAPTTLLYSTLATQTGNKAVIVAGNTEDINKAVTTPITADAYFSTLVNVQNTTALSINTANGEYFMHLANGAGTTLSSFTGRLFIRQGTLPNTFNIGILNNSGGATAPIPTYSTVDYAISTTYFIVVKYVVSTNTASLWINPATGLATEPTTTLTSSAGTNAAPANIGSIVIRQAGTVAASTTTGNVEIDEIRVGTTWASVTPAGPVLPPTLTAAPTSLAFGNVLIATNSTEQSYVLNGNFITNPVTVTAPAEFQISATATGTYGTTLTYTVAQMASAQTVFVRASPITSGAKTGDITHASTGVTTPPTVAVTANGTNTPPPTLTVTPASLAFGNIITTTNSVAQSYVLTGTNLTNDVTITAPAEFQVSATATGTFATTLTLTLAQMATPQTVFVRASPLTTGTKIGNVTHASTGVVTLPTVALTATATTSTIVAGLSVADFGTVNTGAVSTVKSFSVRGDNLTTDLVVTAPTNFQVSKDGVTFSTSISFTAVEVAPLDGKTVFARFAPTSGVTGLKDVLITSTSVGATAKTTSVKGTETSPTTALDNSFAKEVVIYPNPAQDSFQIKLPTNSKVYALEIVDISGKVILTKKSDEIISVENLQKGFYFVKFSNAERTFTKKLSIN